MFHKSIEYQTYAFTEDGFTSLPINGPKFTICQLRTSLGDVSPLYSCKMAAGRRRLMNLQEVDDIRVVAIQDMYLYSQDIFTHGVYVF